MLCENVCENVVQNSRKCHLRSTELCAVSTRRASLPGNPGVGLGSSPYGPSVQVRGHLFEWGHTGATTGPAVAPATRRELETTRPVVLRSLAMNQATRGRLVAQALVTSELEALFELSDERHSGAPVSIRTAQALAPRMDEVRTQVTSGVPVERIVRIDSGAYQGRSSLEADSPGTCLLLVVLVELSVGRLRSQLADGPFLTREQGQERRRDSRRVGGHPEVSWHLQVAARRSVKRGFADPSPCAYPHGSEGQTVGHGARDGARDASATLRPTVTRFRWSDRGTERGTRSVGHMSLT